MRFQPDTWLDALLRPITMAAADANVYVEFMAPDFRFVFALVLIGVLAGMTLWRRRQAQGGPSRDAGWSVLVLAGALAVAFVPWNFTSGNGRYFLAGLLVIGPVCVGLAWLLPATRALRLTLAVGMVALQAFAMQQSVPWRAWSLSAWQQAPYFQVDLPGELREQPATYVTMSAISYSLLAPMLHPDSRWINLHNAPPPDAGAQESRRTEAFLAGWQPGRLMLLTPVIPGMQTPDRLPNDRVADVIGQQLAAYRLAFVQPRACRFQHSNSLAAMGVGEKTPEERSRSGFWLCQLERRDAAELPMVPAPGRHDAVYRALEAQCPRFFPRGGDGASVVLSNGEVRSYLQGEMKAYVYDGGEVYYKYYRALNPVLVGQVQDVLQGKARVDCGRIRGRSGLPWEREI